METSMNLDPQLLSQLLSTIPYPISKGDLLELARQNGIDERLIRDLDALLPDKTYISVNEVLDLIPKWEV
jgi:hypothetical protein